MGPSNHFTTPLFLEATAIALVVTLLMVFNAEILAWPIRRLRYLISNSVREKMGRTPNRFLVTWAKTLDRIKDAEEHDILHDHEMPKWPRSKFVYLLFLIIYLFVDFPASRIVLAYESVTNFETKFPDHATLVVVRLLVALILSPVFAISWMILVIWSLLCRILIKAGKLPFQIWEEVQAHSDQKHEDHLKRQYESDAEAEVKAEAREKIKREDGAKDRDRESMNSVTRGEKSRKRGKAKTVEERIQDTRRKERKERDDRMRQHVKLLINPPELVERMEPKALKMRRKRNLKNNDDSTSPRASLENNATEINPRDNRTMSATQNHTTVRRLVRHFMLGRPEKKVDDERVVEGRDK